MAGVRARLQFFPCNLDADNVAVMTYAKLAETEAANRLLTAFDYVKSFARHRATVLNPRRETGGGGFVPDAQNQPVWRVPEFPAW